MIIYHGSKSLFETFDPMFFRTGERVGEYKGWYFTDNFYGAQRHIEVYLHHIDGDGYVYKCLVDDGLLDLNCEKNWSDPMYRCQAVGVPLENSSEIAILDIVKIPTIGL